MVRSWTYKQNEGGCGEVLSWHSGRFRWRSSKGHRADDGTEHALIESIHIFNKEFFYETDFIRSKFSKFSNVIIS